MCSPTHAPPTRHTQNTLSLSLISFTHTHTPSVTTLRLPCRNYAVSLSLSGGNAITRHHCDNVEKIKHAPANTTLLDSSQSLFMCVVSSRWWCSLWNCTTFLTGHSPITAHQPRRSANQIVAGERCVPFACVHWCTSLEPRTSLEQLDERKHWQSRRAREYVVCWICFKSLLHQGKVVTVSSEDTH